MLEAGWLWFNSQQRQGFSSLPLHTDQLRDLPNWEALSQGIKQPRHEADHSPPSGAKVKNVWSYTSTPPCVFMAWYLIKHKENLPL
jgi:hypothetical protein